VKRSGPLRRTGGLARSGPPARRTALTTTRSLTTGQPLARTKALAPESTRRRAERSDRTDVRESTLAAAGHRCQAIDLVPEIACWGPLDVDEITPRGVRPGAHLEHDQTQVLCRGHHDWKGLHPDEAHARGLRRWSWENPT
jgi:hypothetical protein